MTTIGWLDVAIWAVPTWLFLVGACATYAALFRDRARGRLRCPKCWYDRAGASSGPCPECGHAVKKARRLRRTRRRWRWGVIGLVLLAAVWPSRYVLRAQQVGWFLAAPTTVLVLIATSDRPSAKQARLTLGERMRIGTVADWQYALYFRRGVDEITYPTTRAAWRPGESVMLQLPAFTSPLPCPSGWEWRLHRPGDPGPWLPLRKWQVLRDTDDGRIDLSIVVYETFLDDDVMVFDRGRRVWRGTASAFEVGEP